MAMEFSQDVTTSAATTSFPLTPSPHARCLAVVPTARAAYLPQEKNRVLEHTSEV
jgi:hypothetical protein